MQGNQQGITVKQKLIAGFSILIGLIVIISVLALMKLNVISSASNLIIDRSLIVNYANQIEIAVFECRRAEKNFLLRKDEKYINRLNKEVKSIKHHVNLIRDREHQEKDINRQLDTIDLLVDEYHDAFMKSARLFKIRQREETFTENNRFVIVARQFPLSGYYQGNSGVCQTNKAGDGEAPLLSVL
ncbi:MCP four helix bundle domain-containing protein [Candidatus Desantisbacteria bacterium]|nr:MCP four helix bundle domain-containing protein [Candidatus Desantisbacteria bacterium]